MKHGKRRKIYYVFMAIMLLMQGLWLPESAANAATSMVIAGEEKTANPGDTVAIPVKVTNNTGIMGLGLDFEYDPAVFQSPSVAKGEVCSAGTFNDSITDQTNGFFTVMWSDSDATTKNGELFTISLTVKESAESQTAAIKISNRTGDTFDGQWNDIEPKCEPISIFVNSHDPLPSGDVRIAGDEAEGKPGDTISIPVKITKNSGIMGLGLNIEYDAELFFNPSVTRGEVCSAGTFNDSITNQTNGSFTVMWSGEDETIKTGVLFTISLTVKESVVAQSTSIKISNHGTGNTFDGGYNDIEPEFQQINVKITTPSPKETVEAYGDSKSAAKGSSVTIPLYLKNGNLIDEIRLCCNYDSSCLEIISIKPGKWMAGEDDYFDTYISSSFSFFSINAAKFGDDDSDTFGNEKNPFVYVECKVLSDAPIGKTVIEIQDDAGSASMENPDYSITHYPFKGSNISITVTKATKKASKITLTSKTATYTGKSISIGTAKRTGSTGKVTYTYYSDKSCKKKLSKAPVNAGTYYVKATVAEDSNYQSATSKVAKLTIKKASQSITGVKTKLTAKKNAKKNQTFQLKGSAKGSISYKLISAKARITVNSKGKLTVPKKTKKGTYLIKVQISAKATANYRGKQAAKTIKVTVR